MRLRLRVDPIGCQGHGLCADLLPELITVDDWGYPIVSDEDVPPHLEAAARHATAMCPRIALALERVPQARPSRR